MKRFSLRCERCCRKPNTAGKFVSKKNFGESRPSANASNYKLFREVRRFFESLKALQLCVYQRSKRITEENFTDLLFVNCTI